MPKSIRTNALTVGNTYIVRGKIAFSRLARQTTDEERARDNERRKQQNPSSISIDRNYTTATIYSAEVLCGDANNPTMEERYAAECMYLSKSKKGYTGRCFNGMNKGNYLPRVYVKNKTTGQFDEIKLEHELANDLNVMLIMKVFPGQNGNNGVSLETVLIDDDLRYYEPSSDVANALAEKGIILNSNGIGPRKASEGIAATDTTVSDDAPMPDGTDTGAGANVGTTFSSMSNTAPVSTGNAFSSAPANDSPFAAQPNAFGPGRTY